MKNFRKSKVTKTLLAVGVAAGLGLTAGTATAGPLFTQWDTSTLVGFTSFSPDDFLQPNAITGTGVVSMDGESGQGNDGAGPGDEIWQTLTWGTNSPAVSSSVSVSGIGQTSFALGETLVTGSVSHDNNPIVTQDPSITLTDATIVTQLFLAPTIFGLSPLPLADTLTFAVKFTETPNLANPCANGDALGVGFNANGCGDIFVIDVEEAGFDSNFEVIRDITTPDLDYTYRAIFSIGGLGTLPEAACIAAGAEAGCIGIQTSESANNDFATSLRIEASAVPVPATLALLGLGLMGVGVSRRRKS